MSLPLSTTGPQPPALTLPVDLAAKWEEGLPLAAFLERFGTEEHRRRWQAAGERMGLTVDQKSLLRTFTRKMKVFVLAGAWCGDCISQCPLFAQVEAVCELVEFRYFDRDTHADLASLVQICGAARVPAVLFVSEDNFPCGLYGDRTLAKYRTLTSTLAGSACPTGLVADEATLTAAVVQEWVDQIERVQWMLRTSGRLRKLHGD
jgi:hypothetical protein